MPWVKEVREDHKCHKPSASKRRNVGSLWQCRKCKKVWRITDYFPTYSGSNLWWTTRWAEQRSWDAE